MASVSTITKGTGTVVAPVQKGAAEAGRAMAESAASGATGNFFRDNALLIGGVLLAVLLITSSSRR